MKSTKQEKMFRALMWAYFLIFLFGGVNFYRNPEGTLDSIITFGTWLGFAEFEPPQDKFWVILATGMMTTIAACCFMASLKVRETKHYVIPVLVSKLTTSCLGFRDFWNGSPHAFHYLALTLIDFPLFVVAFVFYVNAIRSKPRENKKVDKKAETEPIVDLSDIQ